MKIRDLHAWDVAPEEAVAIQRRLAPLVRDDGAPAGVRFVAGTDISVGSRFDVRPVGRAAVVVFTWPDLEPVEQSVVEAEVRFPYVPGLLSFREIPALAPALERLQHAPDLIIVDGQGRAHPRRIGLASHLGLLLDVPTIGCAKSRLTGRPAEELGPERGARTALVDRGDVVGMALRTRPGTNPLYVSAGHRISLESAVAWVLSLAPRFRLPEPTRLAHQAAAGRRVAPSRTITGV